MTGIEIACGAVMIILSIAMILLVLRQESTKGNAMNALSGGDSYLNKNQGRTNEAMLFRATKIVGILFFVVGIVVYLIITRFL